ncbi:transposase [Streptomyces eurythermus]|uniref:transposase n=1 Tax=Streptomyces eurythermus TaxID=42237 RepID=UPI0036F6DCB9
MTSTIQRARTAATRATAHPKTVLTDVGLVEIVAPRDRDGPFEPEIVKKGRSAVHRPGTFPGRRVCRRVSNPSWRTARIGPPFRSSSGRLVRHEYGRSGPGRAEEGC